MAKLGKAHWSRRTAGRARRALMAIAVMVASGLFGCRNLDNAQVDVMERELRQQEDYIYELEDYLIEYSEKLRQARISNCPPGTPATTKPTQGVKSKGTLPEPTIDEDLPTTPRLPLNGRNKPATPLTTPPSTAAPTAEAPPASAAISDAARPEAPATTPPAAAPPSEPATELKPEEMEAPPLEIGPGASTLPWKKMNSHSLAKAPTKPAEVAAPALLIPDPLDYEASADAPSPAATSQIGSTEATPAAAEKPNEPVLAAPAQSTPRLAAEKLQVRHIFRESGEEPQQGKQSIGNLLVVIEALNATDEPADGTGEASLMVIRNNTPGRRPSNPADFSVINRWDFTPDETKAAWQSSQLGDGLHLELPLGDTKLPDDQLELWARLVCPDGRKLLTQFPFDPTQLASIDDATEKAALASAEQPAARPIPAPENAEVAPASNAATKQEPAPSWRASSVNLDPNRVEGFATTAGSSSGGWTKRPVGEPRIASVFGESSTTDRKPTWKRSATAQAVGGAPQAWAPER